MYKISKVCGANYCVDSISIVVPANKVLKIESASGGVSRDGITSVLPTSFLELSLDNSIIYSASIVSTTTYNYQKSLTPFPIWLPSGTYTLAMYSDISNSNYRAHGYISGIEYNIVP